MPAFCAAFGSFHVKSSSTSFIIVLMTIRVLPFFLTVTFIRSGTLMVSTFGARWWTRGIGRCKFLPQGTHREFRQSLLHPLRSFAPDQACSRSRPARTVFRAAASDEGRAKRRRASPHR